MSQRETSLGREEIAGWLEEMAAQLRSGTLMVDGEGAPVPEEARARLKGKRKEGRRRIRLDLEWPDEEQATKSKKGKKKQTASPRDEGAAAENTAGQRTSCGEGDRAGCEASTRSEGAVENARGSVRDHDSHVLVCKGGDCSKKGGKETRKALKSRLREEGMNGDVRIDSVECLGLCKQGPNVIVYPEGSWYLGLKERDVPEVIEEHLKGGEPVERLSAERRSRRKRVKS